jgi:hypothetical protein
VATRGASGWSPLPGLGERMTDGEGLLEAVVPAEPAATYRVEVLEGDRWVSGEPLVGAR